MIPPFFCLHKTFWVTDLLKLDFAPVLVGFTELQTINPIHDHNNDHYNVFFLSEKAIFSSSRSINSDILHQSCIEIRRCIETDGCAMLNRYWTMTNSKQISQKYQRLWLYRKSSLRHLTRVTKILAMINQKTKMWLKENIPKEWCHVMVEPLIISLTNSLHQSCIRWRRKSLDSTRLLLYHFQTTFQT